MPEKQYFSTEKIIVTDSRILINDKSKTYATKHVASVQIVKQPPENRSRTVGTMVVGGLGSLVGFVSDMPALCTVAFVIVFFSGLAILLSQDNKYIIRLSVSSGEVDILTSYDKDFALQVSKAIEKAITQPQSKQPSESEDPLKKTARIPCPFCGEFVMPNAIACRFCGSSLSPDDLLKQGIDAVKAGDKVRAQRLLTRVTRVDKHNETAWLWLAGSVENDDDRCVYLEKVLEINPDNKWAQRGLENLRSNSGKST